MTRGAITTFSIANDVAKYFAIVPVMFAAVPRYNALNILQLGVHSAVLSALIFNAIIIPLVDSSCIAWSRVQAIKHHDHLPQERLCLRCGRSSSALHRDQTNRYSSYRSFPCLS